MLVLAHISDTHFDGGRRAVRRAERVMKYLNRLPGRLDAIIVTGDIADSAAAIEYQHARAALQSDSVPILTCPGNHDARESFRTDFLHEDGSGPVNRVHVVGEAVVVMCDSSIPGQSNGHLSDETLAWLQTVLDDAPPSAPIFIAFHHPPVRLFSPIVDPIRLDAPDSLATIIANDSRIVAVLCGHAHTAAITTFAGVPLIVGPSVSSVLGPEWEGDGVTHDPVVDYAASPSIAFHVLDDDLRLTTHFRSVVKPDAARRRGFHRGYSPHKHT